LTAGVKYLKSGDDILPGPEAALRDAIAAKGKKHDGEVSPRTMYRLISAFDRFKSGLESEAVAQSWLTTKPTDVVSNWGLLGGAEIALAIIVGFFWLVLGASGLLVGALATALAGAATIVMARWMPCRTRQGAMLWSMLSAYKRTLQLTMAQAASIGDVVKSKALPWVTTPDQVMAWSVAFGLDRELEGVLSRSLAVPDEQSASQAASAWQPAWWLAGSSAHSTTGISLGHAGGSGSSGLFSASLIPDPGSMIAALGAAGHPSGPPSSGGGSSSSSSFGGGSFGGGGGGGGGGAGGGF
jgi:hypothetical protein